jgi:molecular chaperone DnaJ
LRFGCGQNQDVGATNQDYYEVLGVPRDADEETIRRAYVDAVRDCHPDVSDTPEDEARFRSLSQAYEVLSRPDSRELYDRYGYRGRGNSSSPGAATWGERGSAVLTEIELRDYEAREGTSRVIRYAAAVPCAECGGAGSAGDPDPGCKECGGTGRTVDTALAAAGIVRYEPCSTCETEICPHCGGDGREASERRLRVRIPAGIEDGAQLRVAGEGDVGPGGGPAGDLLLDVHLVQPPRDSRLIRYLAAALFVVAVALLLAYLLLR